MTTESTAGSFRLSEEAARLLKKAYRERGSSLSSVTEGALTAVLRCLEDMLMSDNPQSDRTVFVSSIDPGIGKTEAVCMFLKAWKARGFACGGGVLVAVSRRDEISAYIERSGLGETDYAVLVAKDAALALKGLPERHEAPVLFTTHQMIRRRVGGVTSFEHLTSFHFQGGPRRCRVWDEGMLPAEPLTMRLDTIRCLLEPLRPISPLAAAALDDFLAKADASEAGERVIIPAQFEQFSGTKGSQAVGQNWAKLASLAGREVCLVSSNRHGRELVADVERLPRDFAPALVLDASARVRETYAIWQKSGAPLVYLPAATADYAALTIKHWDTFVSRSTFGDAERRSNLLRSAAGVIDAEAEKRWLVIHHQAKGDLDIARELLSHLKVDGNVVEFCNWGNHHGRNDFREIDRVLVLGLWHMSPAGYHALHRASSQRAVFPKEQELRDLRAGEHRHNLLQALCRSAVRNNNDGRAGLCTAYVIGRINRDTRAELTRIFPGAEVRPWEPMKPVLRGRSKQVIEALAETFGDPGVQAVGKADLRKSLGIAQSQGLAQVLSKLEVRDAIARLGVRVTTRRFERLAA